MTSGLKRLLAATLFCAALAGMQACSKPAPATDESKQTVWLDLARPDTLRLERVETEIVDFASPASYAFLGAGWRDEDQDKQLIVHNDGTVWAGSVDADLRLTVLEPRTLKFSLELQQLAIQPGASLSAPPQQIAVAWNHTPLGTCAFKNEDGWTLRTFTFDVPPEAQISGVNVVTLSSRYALSPAQLYGGDNDKRKQAFGIKSLRLGTRADAGNPAPPGHFADGAIAQSPRSRIVLPVRLPEQDTCALALDGVGNAGSIACRLAIRVDSPDGVREVQDLKLNGPRDEPLYYDLAKYRGQVIEAVLDAGRGDSAARVVWKAPRILAHTPHPAEPPPAPTAPVSAAYDNAVIVVLDALRADHVGAYGYPRDTTPNIDGLAAEGSVMLRAYATVPYTYCSTWGLFTGQYPYQHGAMGPELVPSSQDLGAFLRKNGIVAGLVSANPLAFHQRDLDEAMEAVEPLDVKPEGDPGLATNKALDFLRRNAAKRFFLYVHYRQPHAPYRAPEGFYKKFSSDPANILAPLLKDWPRVTDTKDMLPTREQRAEIIARYDENIAAVDDEIRKLAACLKELGLDRKTLVVITSDHGEGFGEHEHCYTHGVTVYEPVVHIPMIFRGTGIRDRLPARTASLASTVDLFPTVATLMGLAPPKDTVSGMSLTDKTASRDEDRIMAFAQAAWTNKGVLNLVTDHTCEAYWWPRYKLIRDNNDARVEVYDLQADPLEQGNLAIAFPVLKDYLLAQAAAWKADRAARPVFEPSKRAEEQSPKTADQLKALGYF